MTGTQQPAASPGVELALDGGVARILLARPASRNSLSSAVCAQLHAVLVQLEADPACDFVVISGSGGSFASGADIGELHALRADPPRLAAAYRLLRSVHERLYRMPQPTLAAIDGPCFGAGLSLAIACDIRIATARSSFGAAPARLGMLYGNAELSRLALRIGMGRTRDLMFTGRRLDAAGALQVGLIEHLCGDDELEARCNGVLDELRKCATSSLRGTKQQLLALEQAQFAPLFQDDFLAEASVLGPDAGEGLAAFIERRAPRFKRPG
jgi:enoyl-CoA hydratase/carnithine racemase